MKTLIGPHLTSSKGFMNIIKEATSINANTFQFFTRNPRGTKAKALDLKDIENFKREWTKEGTYHLLHMLLIHIIYLRVKKI